MILHVQDMDMLRQFAVMTNDTAGAATFAQQENQYLDLMNIQRAMTFTWGHGYSSLP